MNTIEYDEERLLKEAAKGDNEAFGRLVIAYQNLVYNTCLTKLHKEADAFDLSQEVFIKLWQKLPEFRYESAFSTWVYRVTVNTCLDFLRKKETTIVAFSTDSFIDGDDNDPSPEIPDPDGATEVSFERQEKIRTIRRLIDSLPDEQREIIILRDLEGYTYEEISEMLDIGIGTIKSRLYRSRMHLKTLLESEGFSDSD